MAISKDLEDSLRACREIQSKYDASFNKDEGVGIEPSREKETEPTQKEEPEPQHTEMPVSIIDDSEKTAADDKKTDHVLQRHPVLKSLLNIFICIFTALLLALLITEYVAHHTSVEGSSMQPTLFDGDQLIVENISYYLHEPERFDIVVFPNNEGIHYIKRIIGLPGETVQIIDGYIYINGKQVEENYGDEVIEDAGLAAEEIVLGKHEYFVLGDNRNGSIDSRRSEIGTVKREQIKGKAWLRFYPFSTIGTIK